MRVIKEDQHRINEKIRYVDEVRLVGDNVEVGVYPLDKAKELAKEQELDLVEISPKAKPPVCKIIDYKKFLYEQKKREKALKSKATKVTIKEIRFGPQTDEHDYEFKKKHAIKFLQEGAKLKAFVFFKGRSIIFKEQGQILLLKLAQELELKRTEIQKKINSDLESDQFKENIHEAMMFVITGINNLILTNYKELKYNPENSLLGYWYYPHDPEIVAKWEDNKLRICN